MKKVFTLLAGAAVSLAGFAAVPNLDRISPMVLQPSPEALASLRASSLETLMNPQLDDVDYTRSWTDAQGNVWDLSLKCSTENLVDYFALVNQDGTAPTMSELPYYPARYMLRKLNATQDAVVDGVIFFLNWPTNYVYKQIFTWDGELDASGNIPEADRDFTPAPPSELMNDANFCRKFQEAQSGYFGAVMNDAKTGWDYYYIVNNSMIKVTGLYNGQEANTIVEDGKVSTLDFRAYDLDDNSVEVRNRIYLSTSRVPSATISNTFSGIGDVEGFEPRYVTTPDFGEIHVFNTGLLSSAILGAGNNDFTEDFGDVTAFYLAAGDPLFTFEFAPGTKAFNADNLRVYLADENARPTVEQANLLLGYLFADAKYAQDPTLDPTELKFNLNEGERKLAPELQQYYTSIYPMPGTFVPAGYNAAWSEIYGLECDNQNQAINLYGEDDNQIAWGTTEGFSCSLVSEFNRFVTTKSANDIIYHYDPTDVSKTRTFSSIGTLPPAAVEGVVAENDVKVVARDGMITVIAAENAPVAIFTLDGKLVKATEGTNVSVEAAKGVYVVRVGDKATKVVL